MQSKRISVTLFFLLACCLRGQNVVTDWARIVQPAVNTPPKAPPYQMILRATIQIAVLRRGRGDRGRVHALHGKDRSLASGRCASCRRHRRVARSASACRSIANCLPGRAVSS
jgi:hypothetical protein